MSELGTARLHYRLVMPDDAIFDSAH